MYIPECSKPTKVLIFEDKSGLVELSKAPKRRTRAKHNTAKHHDFGNLVHEGLVSLEYIEILEQADDLLTKTLGWSL